MRHDPASAAVVVMLRSLKMHGMAQAVGELLEQGAPAFDTAVPILSQLLKAEIGRTLQPQQKSAPRSMTVRHSLRSSGAGKAGSSRCPGGICDARALTSSVGEDLVDEGKGSP